MRHKRVRVGAPYLVDREGANTLYTGPHFAAEWRGRSFFAEVDEAQIDAGIDLTLTRRPRMTSRAAFRWRRSSVTAIATKTKPICFCPIGCSRKSKQRGFRCGRERWVQHGTFER